MEREGSWSQVCVSRLQTRQWMTSWGHSVFSTALSQPQVAEGSRLTPQVKDLLEGKYVGQMTLFNSHLLCFFGLTMYLSTLANLKIGQG